MLIVAAAVFVAGVAVPVRTQDVRIGISNPANVIAPSIPTGTGAVSGQVRDAASDTPMQGVVVTLIFGTRPARALTDAQGRFSFPDLPKGSFYVGATAAGFSEGAYGRLRPGGPSLFIDLNDGERVADLVVLLWPRAVISGTVVDDIGEPVIGATVRSYRRIRSGGHPRLVAGPTDTTDDRGVFRITGLDAGEYIVGLPMTSHAWPVSLENYMLQGAEWPADLSNSSAGQISSLIGTGVRLGPGAPVVAQVSDRALPPGTSTDGRLTKYAAQFFAVSSTVADAMPIAVAPGEDRGGVAITLRSESSWNVSGTVTGLDSAVDDLVLRLSPAGAAGIDTAVAVTDFRGRFTFLGVPPGAFVIRALRWPKEASTGQIVTTAVVPPGSRLPIPEPALPTSTLFWAEQPVTVGGADLTVPAVVLRAGAKVRGRIAFDGTTAVPAPEILERIRVTLEPADEHTDDFVPDAIRGRGERNGQFATIGAPSGKYIVGVTGLPAGWSLAGVMAGGRDISVEPFDLGTTDITGVTIQLTDRPASIAGRVFLSSGAADPNASVVVFPVAAAARVNRSPSPRQLRSVRADRNGAFTVRDLPVGQYFVAAINEAGAADWQRPEYLEALARSAMRVDLSAGESKQATLQAVRVDAR